MKKFFLFFVVAIIPEILWVLYWMCFESGTMSEAVGWGVVALGLSGIGPIWFVIVIGVYISKVKRGKGDSSEEKNDG